MNRVLIFIPLLLILVLESDPLLAEDPVRFSRDILPILSDRCFHCHGPDKAHREAELRLDQKDSIFGDRKGSGIVVPGQPESSELFLRVVSDDPDERMPPVDSGRKPLDPSDIALLKRWIKEGASWGKHWSFEKPVRPEVANPDVHPIDYFIQRQLKTIGLTPSPAASREVLIRRVSLDLIGLPPTLEEIEAFVNDRSANAYERVVDRLLDSPHYGERMAWPWLDAARYADTGGYQGDPDRSMWPWRDWVINALNENMPFDQFTIEQLAGDLLPNATPEQRLATGFNRNHMHNSEGGRIAEETRIENVFDRTETTGTVWLGLTLQCARCHDHKFDPTSNQDYFAFFDFFNQTSEDGRTDRSIAVPPSMNYVSSQAREKIAACDQRIAALQSQLRAPSIEADAAQVVWEKKWRQSNQSNWDVLNPGQFRSTKGATITKRDDGALHVTGKRPETDVYELEATTSLKLIRGIRLEALVDPESPAQGTGRDEKGNFVLSELECFVRSAGNPSAKPQVVRFKKAQADFAQGDYVISKAIDGKVDPNNGWAVSGHTLKVPRTAIFFPSEPIENQDGSILSFRLRFESQHTHHTMALFRLSVADSPLLSQSDPEVAGILKKPGKQRNADEISRLREYYRLSHDARFRPIARKLAEARAERDQWSQKSKATKVMVMDTLKKRRETLVLVKGIYNDRTSQKVTSDVPGMLPPLPKKNSGEPFNRLDLARWIVSKDNPLTARVIVNRYWQTFFGRGLVSTPNDFGLQGKQPTHPDLLDWLAVEFMESGWNVKELHKKIVTSQTYRQSSVVQPAHLKVDPDNVMLARAPRIRMPSWMLRDQALAVSGLLVPVIGGAPVRPYQPDGIWAEATFGKKRYSLDSGNRIYRRSIYTFWRRIIGPTLFFDAARRQTCEVKPNRTNTPLHALTTLNDVTFVEAARVLAQRILTEKITRQERIAKLFEVLTARKPEPRELTLLTNRLDSYVKNYDSDRESAEQLLSLGRAPRDAALDPARLAAYTTLINTLMNLDEAIVKP